MSHGFKTGHVENIRRKDFKIKDTEQKKLEEKNKSEKDKLQEELGAIKGRIFNVEQDLNGCFKNNKMVKQKLDNLKKEKEKLEKKLEELK